MSSLALKSPNRISIQRYGIIEHTFQFLAEGILHIISLILVGEYMFRTNDMSPVTFQYYV
jgi:hypothetical protein